MKRLSWIALPVVVVVALAIGSTSRPSRSLESRTNSVASTLRCPVCSGESVNDSQAPVAKAIRTDIKIRLANGESPSSIRSFYVSKYGNDVLLRPKASGISLLAWVIPVLAALFAIVLVAFLISRWRLRDVALATSDKQADVEKALGL